MKNSIIFLLLMILCFSCKSPKKENKDKNVSVDQTILDTTPNNESQILIKETLVSTK